MEAASLLGAVEDVLAAVAAERGVAGLTGELIGLLSTTEPAVVGPI